jgi:anti-anti-sigma factor
VDILTAPDLGAIVDALVDRGHLLVVLDLAALDFMDASGLRVIAGAARRLEPLGGKLTIRHPSALVRRLLDITGLVAVVHLEHPQPLQDALGPAPSVAVRAGPGSGDLGQRLMKVRAIPARTDVVDGALRLVVALARASVGHADGVSVSLRRHGRLATVAASDPTIADMDAAQYLTGEGPCVDAAVEGRWFYAASLDTEVRWPAFTPKAQALGINAILSTPLSAQDQPVGSINIYSHARAAFTPTDQKLASVFAEQASALLSEAGVDVTDGQLAEWSDDALSSRQVIAQAQGMMMQRDGISGEDAHTALRRLANSAGLPLREHATQVVASVGASRRDHVSSGHGDHDA